ncbi:MAG: SsrA-binding protein SmpB [Elusimicrobiota bacterium]
MAKRSTGDKTVVASNRKARHQFEILEVFEAGLSLKGPEVKSLRAGKARLLGTFARVEGDELYIHNLYIAPYAQNTQEELEPTRTRKLLMRRREIRRLKSGQEIKGLTIVPLELHFRRGWAKVDLALAKGKRGRDKRESIKKREDARELGRSFKGKFKA